MPAYVIADVRDAWDAEALDEYRRRNTDAVAHHGAELNATTVLAPGGSSALPSCPQLNTSRCGGSTSSRRATSKKMSGAGLPSSTISAPP
jgi:hypothetical protein